MTHELCCNAGCCVLQVALLADGLTIIAATPLGGIFSDRYASRSNLPVARLVPNTFIVLALGPVGTLGAAWALHFKAHLAIVLVTVSIAGFGGCFYLPAMFSYISTVKQSVPAAATAGVQTIMAMAAGSVVALGAVARSWLGYGWWLTCQPPPIELTCQPPPIELYSSGAAAAACLCVCVWCDILAAGKGSATHASMP